MELESLSADYLSLISCGGGAVAESGVVAAPYSDVTFCVEGRHISAHRCILTARSHFFKLMFSHHHLQTPSSASVFLRASPGPSACTTLPSLFVPIDVVGFDAFLALLRFLYSGRLILSSPAAPPAPPLSPSASNHPSSPCPLPSCPHSSCSYAIDLLLQLIPAAHFFGVHQLAELAQTRLGKVLEEGVLSMESLMKVLIMARKHKMQHVWHVCADLVINSGLDCSVMRRFFPREVLAELAETRVQRSACDAQIYGQENPLQSSSHSQLSGCSIMCSMNTGACCSDEQKILRLQQALDCMDVELVRLMVMGEGLNLDKALALHYSVANCSRDVVKALLELGVVDVNCSDSLGRTALHIAADMGNAEMIAVLLDHHADPNVLTHDGFAAVDILRGLIKSSSHDHFHRSNQQPIVMPPLCKTDQKRIHLCIELLQSASAVAGREEAAESSCVTQAAAQIFNTSLNKEAPGSAFLPCDPRLLLAMGMPIPCGFRLSEVNEAVLPIPRNHDQIRGAASGSVAQSSQFDAASCRLAAGSSLLSSMSAPVSCWMNKGRHPTAISSSELNHLITNAAQTMHHINVMNEEPSSLISSQAVNQSVNRGGASYSAAAHGANYEQSTAVTESASTNHPAVPIKDGKLDMFNGGTGSSSEG